MNGVYFVVVPAAHTGAETSVEFDDHQLVEKVPHLRLLRSRRQVSVVRDLKHKTNSIQAITTINRSSASHPPNKKGSKP